ncbi:MAG: M48 family metallopeptidase [Flavipsychrobacter sp.]|jgi:beta-barrel assembly-enhancing protease
MNKILFKGAISVITFVALWYGLSMMPWAKWLKMDEFVQKRQKQVSELFLKLHRLEKNEMNDARSVQIIQDLKNRLCLANNIDTAEIQIHLFKDLEVNAFAIPGGHIIVNSALVTYCDSADMLAGVVAHEIGHIERGHIAKRFAREIGLSMVMMIGGDNLGLIKEIIHRLTSGKFDRGQESDADAVAVVYVQKAGIDPLPLAGFFNKMAELNGSMSDAMEWISTHPDSKERAKKILSGKYTGTYTPAIDSSDWRYLVEECN